MLIWFLIVIGVLWLLFATISDFKSHEIPNWVWISLIAFSLGARFFYGLFVVENFGFLYQGLIWLVIFFGIANLFYYSRLFAMGDAKLMMALGALLPFYEGFFNNLYGVTYFIILFLGIGAIYGLIISLYFVFGNFKGFKKEFKSRVKKDKNLIGVLFFAGLIVMILGFNSISFLFLGILIILMPLLYFYAKAIDEACMIKMVSASRLTIGDWLYQDVKVGKKTIKASWDGLSEEDIKLLKKANKKVLIRRGIWFGITFLISFIVYVIMFFMGFA